MIACVFDKPPTVESDGMTAKPPPKRYDVLVSYSRKDDEKRAELVAALEARGYDVFWDRKLGPDYWRPEWRNLCHQSPLTIVLWSVDAVRSKNVNVEAIAAWQLEKCLSVPLDGEEHVPEPLRETNLHHWDRNAEPAKRKADLEKIIAKVEQIVGPPGGHSFVISRRAAIFGSSASMLLGGLASHGSPRLISELSGWTRSEEEAARHLYNALGLNSNPRVVFGSEYKNYPNVNTLAGRTLPSTRSEKTAREVVEFAQSVDRYSELSCGKFDKFFKPEPGQFDLSANSSLVDARPKVFWQPDQIHEAIVAISSSKTNPATRHMMGYLTRPDAPKDFISLDGTWGARLRVNQFVCPNSVRAVRDPIFKDWARYDAAMVVDNVVDQTVSGCHFTITKLEKTWLGGSKQQRVAIISALHGPGLAAARSLFKRPLAPAALKFIDDLHTATKAHASWQAWARVVDVQVGEQEYGFASIDLKGFWPLEPAPIST